MVWYRIQNNSVHRLSISVWNLWSRTSLHVIYYMTRTLFWWLVDSWASQPQTLASHRHDFPLATWRTATTVMTTLGRYGVFRIWRFGPTFRPKAWPFRMWKTLRLHLFLVETASSSNDSQESKTWYRNTRLGCLDMYLLLDTLTRPFDLYLSNSSLGPSRSDYAGTNSYHFCFVNNPRKKESTQPKIPSDPRLTRLYVSKTMLSIAVANRQFLLSPISNWTKIFSPTEWRPACVGWVADRYSF